MNKIVSKNVSNSSTIAEEGSEGTEVSQTSELSDHTYARIKTSSLQTSTTERTDSNTPDKIPGKPDTISVSNCNNNNHEASSILAVDLADGVNADLENQSAQVRVDVDDQAPNGTTNLQQRQGLFRKSVSCDGRYAKGQGGQNLGVDGDQGGKALFSQRQGHFRKSASCDKRDGASSPSSARRKVSAHHTKILTRQLTPMSIEVPKQVITGKTAANIPSVES